MLKKNIKYVDFDGNEREEDFYFNLTQAELTEMETSHNGGLSTMLKRLVQEQNTSEIVKIIKELILKSYGEKSDDGKHFRKSDEISKSFSETEAYSVLFMEVVSNPEAAMDFVNGCLPAAIREQIKLEQNKQEQNELTENAQN